MKYVALTLSAAATVLLVLALIGIAQGISKPGRSMLPLQTSLSPISPQQLNDQADVKQALQALLTASAERSATLGSSGARGLADWQASGSSLEGPFSSIFAIAGPLPELEPTAGFDNLPKPRPQALPRVSVVVADGDSASAMVDGRMRKVGDTVRRGLRIKAIALDTVTFTNGREDMLVSVPLERLRVMGAYPAAKGAQ
ncbi:hypothetical protein [Hydrogenophaga sp. 5NK40-0174]|uniref:hypothetical protein n=1 Tax=Hydrogenophaga sp. 5NK40-0174 TaxID=3127649 RepID=UPI003101D1FA